MIPSEPLPPAAAAAPGPWRSTRKRRKSRAAMEAEEDAEAEAELEREMPRGKRRRGAARRRAAEVKRPVGVDKPQGVAAAAETPRVMEAGRRAIGEDNACAEEPDAADMSRATWRRRRKAAALMEADADAGHESRGKRRRGAAWTACRKRAAKDKPEEPVRVRVAEVPGTMEVGDDDMCAEEPDAEEFLTEEEEEAALEAEEQAMCGERSAGARPRAAERRAVDDGASSEDHFVGEPVPDEEARRRWPARYRTKDSGDSQAWRRRSDGEITETLARCHYRTACVDGVNFDIGDDVYLKAGPGEENYIARITEFFEGLDQGSYFAAHWFYRVADTVISLQLVEVEDHKHDHKRIFLSDHKDDNTIDSIISKVNVIYVDPNMTLEAKSKIIEESDFYYDMSYSLACSTFANMPADIGIATGSEATSDISSDDVDSSKEKPNDDLVSPPDAQIKTAALLDLYSGCGAMSTGLCLGAALSGIKLITRWAVDLNTHACSSLKHNHPFTQVRNEKAENFLSLIREWNTLCKKFDVHKSISLSSDLPRTSNENEEYGNEPLLKGTFEVERLIDICYGDPNSIGKVGLWFKVRWRTFDRSEDTWEPVGGLSDSPDCIKEFVQNGYRESILPLPVLPKYPLPTHDVVKRGLVPRAFMHCLVAYKENEYRHLEKALVLGDAISDLPKVGNHQPNDVMEYSIKPKTEFQHYIRLNRQDMKDYSHGDATPKEGQLFDHQPLQLNRDDYERGANFRDLKGVRVPSYAMTFSKGKSLKPFGRLWWDETVATVVTRAEPHNQIILHPTQHRVLTIRENARLQGFPDYYRLLGPIKQKYIQVGNAVAVPVARALGYSLGLAYQGKFHGDQPLFKLPGNFIPIDHATDGTVKTECPRAVERYPADSTLPIVELNYADAALYSEFLTGLFPSAND
ncbi:DNA (cytosine-5)-methyltransferase CMT1-like [Lolium rigidum]|uniref:DNA (cytosine-5)-methyltransferase CMT1-like n=1 Tax=Lolium rigidum TaxID=89674 RepID=UPI001F5CCF87|nr:DNA (cytosine-5)-methyltransferase CMT1-like [Lolium rigidum]